jgi:sugar phosphate permease
MSGSAISLRDRLRVLALVVLPLVLGPVTYKGWKESSEGDLLEAKGTLAIGTVIHHQYGPKACRSLVVVEYSVAGAKYTVNGVSPSCSYVGGNRLVGRSVDVRYVSNAPEIAEVVVPSLQIESNRVGWAAVFPLVLVSLFIWWVAFTAWRTLRGPKK